MSATIRCRLEPATADMIRPQDRPALPLWWPLPTSREMTETVERGEPMPNPDKVRRDRELREACEGPSDGSVGKVIVPPPDVLHVADGAFGYRLQPRESTPKFALYRYSPADSPGHRELMRATEEAFYEVGRQGVAELAQDDEHAIGYAERQRRADEAADAATEQRERGA